MTQSITVPPLGAALIDGQTTKEGQGRELESDFNIISTSGMDDCDVK